MDTVVAMPVVVQRQLPWFRRQKTAQVPQLQYFYVVDVSVVQVHLGSSSPWTRSLTCPLLSTTWVMQTVKVPQIQLVACFCGHSSCATQTGTTLPAFLVMAAMDGFFFADFPHFSRSCGYAGVERQFSEPSMAKSSSLSRAPAQLVRSSMLALTARFVNIRPKQQQQ